jgi:Coenzyme PQQ synthesis protein D (PqqD)
VSGDELRLRTTGLTWRNVAGELIVLDLDGSVYLAANGTGALVWDALSRGATRATLVQLIVDRYAIEEARASSDVDDFLARLGALGLIET